MTDLRQWQCSGVLRRSGAVAGSALLAGGAVGSAALLSVFASPAGAVTTYTVDTSADGVANASDCVTPVVGSCSLRDALAAATTTGDVIVFDAALSGATITTNGQLLVTAGITITGLGSANLTVDAATNSRVFYVTSGANGAAVAISGLSIINGDAGTNNGGGIYDYHHGDLTLTDTTITGNEAGYGGGVYKGTDGDLEIVDSTISNNTVYHGGGGGFYTGGTGDLVITNSVFDSNTADFGGAGEIGNTGDATIVGSTFSNNSAIDNDGGALYFESSVVDVLISGSTFTNNAAINGGGALYSFNSGSFTVTSSSFTGNTAGDSGGALYLGTGGQVITVTDSLFAYNSAEHGGALDFDGVNQIVTINNSTFVGNSATTYSGGAIWKDGGGSLTINMSTITENDAASGGGGVYFVGFANVSQADVTITGTILTGNTGVSGAADDLNVTPAAVGAVATVRDSILGVVDADITVTASNNIDATVPGFTLGLAALASNGGATQTMALLTGSPAIDAGPATVPTFTGNGFDQRGTPFVRVANGRSDIGAFEVQALVPTTTTTSSGQPVVPAFTG